MLGKILKYDLKWVYKLIIIFYALAFIFSVIGRAFGEIENSLVCDIISKICFGTAISMVVSSLINSLMRLWARFVRNVYKDESYLTDVVDVMIKSDACDVVVYNTNACWLGVTYAEDKPAVVEGMKKLIEDGVYPEHLWK